MRQLPERLGAFSDVHMWGVPSYDLSPSSLLGFGGAVLIVAPLFGLVALTFIPVGQLVAWHLEEGRNGIFSYTVNVIASLVGIMLYTALCLFYQPPAVWFFVAGLLLLAVVWKRPTLRWSAIGAIGLCVALAAIGPGGGATTYWSPYQKLTVSPWRQGNETLGYNVSTNDAWYQVALNLSPGFVKGHPDLFKDLPIQWNAYNVPYHFAQQPESVLVLGAGTGNDVAAALRNGANRVVAVEIDPLILKMGRQLHPEKPYSSGRVTQVLDDARSYIENSTDKFDLIMFSLLDSHTTSSYFSNIRIDNYVYTLEALRKAKTLLKPSGLFVVKFWIHKPWIAGRINELLTEVFGRPPAVFETDKALSTTAGTFFIGGSQEKIDAAMRDPELGHFIKRHSDVSFASAALTTDDWPYFYQHEPGLPASVIVISAVLIVVCWLAMRRVGGYGSVRWHFFFLGAGFMLVESQIVSKMALLFGTTWLVNSIVIAGVLLLIVGANMVAERLSWLSLRTAYAGILVTIALSYLIPLEKYFFHSFWLKVLVSTLVLCSPVFFAGIVFIRSFAAAGFSGEALGSNLIGSLAGGLLESVSMWAGLSSLLIIAAVLYVSSYIAIGERKRATVAQAGAAAAR
jgi:spermidine synthase